MSSYRISTDSMLWRIANTIRARNRVEVSDSDITKAQDILTELAGVVDEHGYAKAADLLRCLVQCPTDDAGQYDTDPHYDPYAGESDE